MLIHVTQSHIDRGCRGDGQRCPVALALEEVTHCGWLVEQPMMTCYIDLDLKPVKVPMPQIVYKFVRRFDAGANVDPFEFELDVEGVG